MKSSAVQPDHEVAGQTLQRKFQWVYAGLAGVLVLHCVISCVGITWGLPSRKIDKYLFGDGEVWSGEKIYRLSRADEKLSTTQISSTGADVDVNPRPNDSRDPVLLTATEENIAAIYLRYRLYTYQPDEMITMMALAGMRPGELQLDPRLYQYGGLFIYPVGALIKLCGMIGLIDVRSDIVFYLDNPDEFGKFYVVARAYSAAWGLIGVIVVVALTRRIADAIRTPSASEGLNEFRRSNIEDPVGEQRGAHGDEGAHRRGNVASLIAALLFTLMPVGVCMSHEGKPHLPGAVLMLLGVYLAIRAVSDNRQTKIDNRKFFWLMSASCGAAVGMVLSSWPICVLIPLTAFLLYQRLEREDRKTTIPIIRSLVGAIVAIAVYFATNPYVLINYVSNREILRSNFGNSLAMYQVDRLGEGFVRVLELTVEGATLPMVALGTLALIVGLATSVRHTMAFWLLAVPAALFFAQFVFIGAGKPAEYGRFGIFTNTALLVATAILITGPWLKRLWGLRFLLPLGLAAWMSVGGFTYLRGFYRDTKSEASRLVLARQIQQSLQGPKGGLAVALLADPAPYSCPPLHFARQQVWRLPNFHSTIPPIHSHTVFLQPLDASISWADKNFLTTFWMGTD